jgi:hypothetical protein
MRKAMLESSLISSWLIRWGEPALLSRCVRQALSSSRLAYSITRRVRIRLPNGSSSSRRNLCSSLASPANTTLSRLRESNCMLESSRSSLSTLECISCASSISSTAYADSWRYEVHRHDNADSHFAVLGPQYLGQWWLKNR